jgi:hypothetical protein
MVEYSKALPLKPRLSCTPLQAAEQQAAEALEIATLSVEIQNRAPGEVIGDEVTAVIQSSPNWFTSAGLWHAYTAKEPKSHSPQPSPGPPDSQADILRS